MSESTLVIFNISRAVFWAACILLDYSFLTPKRPVWFQVIAFGSTWIAAYLLRVLLTPTGLDPFLIGYMLTLLYLVPIVLVFKETIQAKFFVLFMVTSLSQFNFLICLFIELIVFKHMVGGIILAGQLVELVSVPLIRKHITPHIKNILEIINHQNPIFTLFPFLSFILLAVYGVQRSYLSSIFIPLVLSTIIISIAYYLIAISIDRTKRQQQLHQQLALQRDHYRNINDSIITAKTARHDLRHHLVTISEILGKNDVPAAQEYLNRLCSSYDDSSIPSVCRNQSADAVICHYLKLARQQGITVETKLHIPDELGIDALDLCVIIGNCLENALEACGKINATEPRFIEISATIAKGHLIIKIANSFNGLVQSQDDGFFSSKADAGHGIGLASVKTLTAKYQGHCMISFDQQVFKVSVSLQLPEAAAAQKAFKNISG
ncbi:MAG: GHKL domain-containing protein [Negativicutes bacterium]|nr:GHKL domain-containing protein [Negativicutes bacterium]